MFSARTRSVKQLLPFFFAVTLLAIILVSMNMSIKAESSEDVRVEVVSHSSYLNYEKWKEIPSGKVYEGNFFHVVGEVGNVGKASVTYSVIVTFYEAEGTIVNVTNVPKEWDLSSPPVLGPGQRHPFVVIILDEETSGEITRYEISLMPQVTENEPYGADFVNHVRRGLYVTGEVQNIEEESIEHVKVVASFYDKEGTIIGADWTYASSIDRLAPEQKAPFKVSIIPLPTELSDRIAEYEFFAIYGRTDKVPYREFQIINSADSVVKEYGRYDIWGTVSNTGAQNATFTKVVATLYDSTGNLVDFGYSFEPKELKIGETSPFNITMYVGSDKIILADTYVLQVTSNQWTIETSIYSSLSQTTIAFNHTLTVKGYITPSPEPPSPNVTLTYIRPDGTTISRELRTRSAQCSFEDTFKPDKAGTWSVKASWEGKPGYNGVYLGAISETHNFTVEEAKTASTSTSGPPSTTLTSTSKSTSPTSTPASTSTPTSTSTNSTSTSTSTILTSISTSKTPTSSTTTSTSTMTTTAQTTTISPSIPLEAIFIAAGIAIAGVIIGFAIRRRPSKKLRSQ